ncbi:MAG: tryptophan-rich sensory protein [Chitinophagaceae bacterium]|nr:MAG: tryptophan-rich sensory protein [Chitinophagaceae bacterium]
MKNGWKLFLSLLIPQVVGLTAGYFTITGVGSWYQTIRRPEWNPPNWLFGPVWTALYILMGIALYLVWNGKERSVQKRSAILLWSLQLAVNFLWSFFFFNQHRTGLALADLAVLWLLILLTIFAFARISKIAAWLLVPYISWVTFAGILNYTIWILNR